MLGHSLESNLRALQLFHPLRIDPRGCPLEPGLARLTRQWLGRTIQDRGPSRHDPEEDTRVCVDSLKSKDQKWTRVSGFKTDYEPIMARIARSQ
jgi:RNA exonuclease